MRRGLALLLVLGGLAFGVSPAAMAASRPDTRPHTRLVACGKESCLLVSGRRADADAEVRINGRPISVEGRRNWKVRLPVETVRAWSVPMARSIDVTVADAGMATGTTTRANLPIGLLGHVTDLAALEIRSP